MKYSNSRFVDSPADIDGILYFAQRLEEMLFDYSSDLYRMPLMNTHSLIREYISISNKVSSGEIKDYQRDIVFEELLATFRNDIILKENWGLANIERIVKSFGSNSPEDKYNTISYLNSTFSNGRYYTWATKTILKYTKRPKEKKKIEAAIRCFVPELVLLGYDVAFIYTTVKKCFFNATVINYDSIKQFLSAFDLKLHTYNVYFSVSKKALHFRSILEKRLHLCFEDDGNFSLYKKDNNKIIVYFEGIKSYCPNSAARKAYSSLDIFFRFYRFIGNKRSFPIQKRAMVKEENSPSVFVDSRKLFYHIIEDSNYEEIGTLSETLITGLLVNAKREYSVLSKAIELHNTAISVSDLKSGFLNFWSAVEILCQGHTATNKIGPVLNVVLPILKKEYLVTHIEELNVALKENLPKSDYEYIISQIPTPGCEKRKIFHLIFLEKYSSLRAELCQKLECYPVLRSRLCSFSNLNTTKKMNEAIERHIQRVKWHIYRIYRARNAIVHSGDIPFNLKYLGEHLHSYLDSTITEFIIKLAGDIPFKSREDVVTDIKFAISNLDSALAGDVPLNEKILDTLIHPEIGYVMNCENHMPQ